MTGMGVCARLTGYHGLSDFKVAPTQGAFWVDSNMAVALLLVGSCSWSCKVHSDGRA